MNLDEVWHMLYEAKWLLITGGGRLEEAVNRKRVLDAAQTYEAVARKLRREVERVTILEG